MKIVLASNNKGKLREFNRLLAPLNVEVHPQGEFNNPAAEEPYGTFLENCLTKARHAAKLTGLPAIADDSGICVNALGGAPGVHSARYATDGHDFAANNRLLLRNLEGAENRRARFRTVISLLQGGEEHLFEGIVEGRIIDREEGHEGFGYDPLFIPDGYDKTFAQMSTEEKNEVSHRARAVRKLAAYLHSAGK